MTEKAHEQIPLTQKERAVVKKIAERDGITEDEAATNLVKAELAHRTRKKSTGGSRVTNIRKR